MEFVVIPTTQKNIKRNHKCLWTFDIKCFYKFRDICDIPSTVQLPVLRCFRHLCTQWATAMSLLRMFPRRMKWLVFCLVFYTGFNTWLGMLLFYGWMIISCTNVPSFIPPSLISIPSTPAAVNKTKGAQVSRYSLILLCKQPKVVLLDTVMRTASVLLHHGCVTLQSC